MRSPLFLHLLSNEKAKISNFRSRGEQPIAA
nr:MAG TPA: hypothetical protein [Caudoviricetes sp.]